MLRNVRFYGRLQEEFGEVLKFDVDSVAEAMKALACNFGDRFIEAFREGSYRIIIGDREKGFAISQEQLQLLSGHEKEFHVMPVPAGQGDNAKGIIIAVIGVALIFTGLGAAGLFTAAGVTSAGLSTTVALGLTAGQLTLLGAGLLLSGLSALITPSIESESFESPERRESFVFRGALNVWEQGGPVRVVYGRHMVGSTVVSAGLLVKQLPYQEQRYQGPTFPFDPTGQKGLAAREVEKGMLQNPDKYDNVVDVDGDGIGDEIDGVDISAEIQDSIDDAADPYKPPFEA